MYNNTCIFPSDCDNWHGVHHKRRDCSNLSTVHAKSQCHHHVHSGLVNTYMYVYTCTCTCIILYVHMYMYLYVANSSCMLSYMYMYVNIHRKYGVPAINELHFYLCTSKCTYVHIMYIQYIYIHVYGVTL